MATSRDLSPEKTEAILDGAVQEFLEHGYAGARIDRIVAAAGVSKATVYRHFPDKEALFTALTRRMASRKELFQMQKIQSFEEEPSSFLRRYASRMLDNVASDPQILTFLRIIIGESGRFPELARSFVQNIEKPSLDFLTYYLSSHPNLQIEDPEVAARSFVSTLIHFVMVRDILHSGDIMPIERDRLLDGLLKLVTASKSSQ
ncbi:MULTISPECIES: TetR/AcrR family transcriptional regulator [unclassified Leptolyngbya]|uniref:TetR/AcrR family transcriptional regulator n=1 Tax=unclassified Leptolyngbya TaxID=2650499 RepID=UPI001687B889|nr:MULTISPECIES: TetR/AcrR family transcriptional regulator [unclassified Leptolyngbya]MBD1909012.1 TetR/AcrR family transcriptional regulator [Leptolyngbya sp. FACHB-8]MBD2158088.1 TetR/AcrR family transcriptional regulator [Leptolyngbya sp. FACHB-16]